MGRRACIALHGLWRSLRVRGSCGLVTRFSDRESAEVVPLLSSPGPLPQEAGDNVTAEPPRGAARDARTLAMNIYIGAYVVAVCLLVYFVLAAAGIVPRPAGPGSPGPPRAPLVVSVAIIAVLGAAGLLAAALWDLAPTRAWFWPVAALPPVFWFAPDLPQFAGFLANPNSLWRFAFALVSSVSLVTMVVTAVISTLQARGSGRG